MTLGGEVRSRKRILAICGSIRSGSSNEKILRIISREYGDVLDVSIYPDLSALPHFSPGLKEDEIPESVVQFLDLISSSEGVIICTPEYIFSLPGVLKNAIEWTVSTTVFSDKPVAMIVASGLGEKTFESLLLILRTLGVKMEDSATLLIQGARSKVGEDDIVDTEMLLGLRSVVDSLIACIG